MGLNQHGISVIEEALVAVFTVLWIAVALSLLVAFFLRVRPVRHHEDSELDTEI